MKSTLAQAKLNFAHNSFCVCALLALASSLSATPVIVNGTFDGATSSYEITSTNLTGWSASPSGSQILDCLVVPTDTTNLCGSTAFGGGMKFWVIPGPSPAGGNYVAIDGDQNYSTPLTQVVSGFTPGKYYTFSFYQASAQQSGFSGATTEQWQVQLTSQGLATPVVATQYSPLMSTPDHGSIGWNYVTMEFQAVSASELLSFIAVGTPNGQPPFVLLDGVGVVAAPEPATIGLIGLGLATLPAAKLLRRRR